MGGACSAYGGDRILVGKSGRHGCRWEDNIKMDLQEVGCEGVWTGSGWLRVGTVGGLV